MVAKTFFEFGIYRRSTITGNFLYALFTEVSDEQGAKGR